MAYVISDSCVSCGTCEPECPVGAISQGDSQFVIDAGSCVSCELVQEFVLQELSAKNESATGICKVHKKNRSWLSDGFFLCPLFLIMVLFFVF